MCTICRDVGCSLASIIHWPLLLAVLGWHRRAPALSPSPRLLGTRRSLPRLPGRPVNRKPYRTPAM